MLCQVFPGHIVYNKINSFINAVSDSMFEYYTELLDINSKSVAEIIEKAH